MHPCNILLLRHNYQPAEKAEMTMLDAIGAGKYFFASRGEQIIGGYQKTIITFLNISIKFSLLPKMQRIFH